ncbi:MAG TPA: LysR substrate-binding domain-containing protein [Vineibacter sp.]|nr:LysR substrate-binding domain-containing protein [Vineibacter sp.]
MRRSATRTRTASRNASRTRAASPRIAAATLKGPQLLSLQAFDVAVRLGSFKATAHALNLTPSAVSHRIKNLEQSLGVALFVRGHRAVRPTVSGKALAAATGRAFAELARVGAPDERKPGRQRLRLKVFPLFASAWLIPRLGNFVAMHPDIDLSIETSSRVVDFDVEAYDAGISVADSVAEGLDGLHLADLRSTPIATPDLVRRLRLRQPRDLGRAVLIEVATFPAAWSQWLERAGVPDLKPVHTITVDSFVAAVQAAEQGAGIALGMNPFIAGRERSGAICRPFPVESPGGSYWLIHPPGARRNRALRSFKTWLAAELPSLRAGG